MDTSETYIKMCDCEEIQGIKGECYLHKSAMGEVVHGLEGSFYYGKPTDEIVSPFVVPMPLSIWLPTQSQLQEMVFANVVITADEKAKALWEYCQLRGVNSFTSMEQLWFAFVMKENHNKVWSGEGWK